MTVACYRVLDDALAALSGYGPELRNGNFNHAPMVAEALCALGRPAAVMPWIECYRGRMLPRPTDFDPEALASLRRDNWRSALGRRDGFAAWSSFFAEELREAPWRAVLDRWVDRLAPGFCAAATHGAIRVGHAVRGLAEAETARRLSELADALASWAATYQELPEYGAPTPEAMTAREALVRLALLPPERRRPGNIAAALKALDDFPEFAATIHLVNFSGGPERMLPQLSEAFARLYLANARSGLTVIVFIHGVTSLAALGHIVPHVGEATARRALRYAWQAGCGLYACFGSASAAAEDIGPVPPDPDWLIDRAIASGDEHAIKFTEACLCGHALDPSPAYFAAAGHAIAGLRR
jgi:Questin oxidase-like